MNKSQFSALSSGLFGWTIFATVVSFWSWAWLGFELPKFLVLSLGLSICFALWFWRGGEVKVPRVAGWVVAYFLILLLYVPLSLSPWASGLAFLEHGLFFAVLFLGFLGGKDLLNGRWFIAMNGLVVLYALVQFVGLDPLQGLWLEENFLGRSFSTLGNPNWLASFLVLTFPLCFKQAKGHWKWMVLMSNLGALLATGSKAGFLAAAVLFLIMLPKKHRLWAGLAGGVTAALSLLGFYSSWWAATRSLGSRLQIWGGTWTHLLERFWGHGLDTFPFLFPSASGPELWEFEALEATITHPHNILLEKWFELGPWGLTIFVVMLGVILWPNRKSPLAWGILAYLITLLFGFEVLSTGVIFWLFLGVLLSQMKGKYKVKIRPLALGLLIFSILIFYFYVQHSRANIHYELAIQQRETGEISESLTSFDRAIELYSHDRIYLLHAVELVLALEAAPEEWMENANEYLVRLNRLSSSMDHEVPILWSWYFSKEGWDVLPEFHMKRAFDMNPSGVSTYKIAMQIYTELGMTEQYERVRDEFLEALPEYWNDPKSDAGRIFRKNNPWVEEI